MAGVGDYWNHNTAYHRWIVSVANRTNATAVLDVGCGDGLLMQRLARAGTSVWGIEPDARTAQRARARLQDVPHTHVAESDFASYDPGDQLFDLITVVATLHHMDLQSSLAKAKSLLRPGGTLMIVGLARNGSAVDWLLAGLSLPLLRLGSSLHGEIRDIGVPVAEPVETMDEIRALAGKLLPGVRIRRGLYYRYLLSWTRPAPRAERSWSIR